MTLNETGEAPSAAAEVTDVAAPAETTQVETAVAEDANTQTAAPSSVDETKQVAKEPASLLEAVKAATDKDKQAEDSTDSTQKSVASEADAKPDEATKDEAKKGEEEAKEEKVPFHKHPRFKEVIAERDSYKEDASQYRQITQYMSANQLTTEEVAKGFEIMAAIKNDPLKAREMLSQYTRALDEFAGVILPQDLSQKVNEGIMDETAAQELARARNEAQLNQSRYEQLAQAQQVYAQQNVQQAIHGTVTGWEETIRQRDPDYAAKQNLVLDRARSYLLQGQPASPQEALAIVERAYADVNETLKGFAPKRQPVRPVTSTHSSTNSQPVARTLQEAIRIAAGAN